MLGWYSHSAPQLETAPYSRLEHHLISFDVDTSFSYGKRQNSDRERIDSALELEKGEFLYGRKKYGRIRNLSIHNQR